MIWKNLVLVRLQSLQKFGLNNTAGFILFWFQSFHYLISCMPFTGPKNILIVTVLKTFKQNQTFFFEKHSTWVHLEMVLGWDKLFLTSSYLCKYYLLQIFVLSTLLSQFDTFIYLNLIFSKNRSGLFLLIVRILRLSFHFCSHIYFRYMKTSQTSQGKEFL